MRQSVYLIFDPYHDYAAAMMRYLYVEHGLQGVCLISTRRYELFAKQYVKIDPAYVADRYYVEDHSDASIIADLLTRYQPIAVIPHDEPYVSRAADYLGHLQIDWNSPALLRLFRDKQALKQRLKANDPGLPLNHTRHLTTAAEGMALRAEFAGPVVLKPNDGMGTQSVVVVQPAAWEEGLRHYFAQSGGRSVIMEEFIEATEPGVEYAVNGQIDATGQIIYQSIISYFKVEANGRSFLYYQDHHVPYGSDTFEQLTAYATRVMQASGLKRCPFHMELVLSRRGPILVEVAARLLGVSWAKVVNDVHETGFDVFALAAHYYLFDRRYPGPGPDWASYNRNRYISVYGIAANDAFVAKVDGTRAVEGLPSFRRWGQRPEVGRSIKRTTDLFSRSYDVQLIGAQPLEALVEAAMQVRKLIQVNQGVGSWDRLRALARYAFDQCSWRCRYALVLCRKIGRRRL